MFDPSAAASRSGSAGGGSVVLIPSGARWRRILIFTISFVILSWLTMESLFRYSVQDQNQNSEPRVDDERCACNCNNITMMINALCVDEVMVAAEVAAENWNDYEIGDGIKRLWKYKGSRRYEVCERWPDSLLCEYFTRTDQANDISVLADIVDQWNNTDASHGSSANKNKPSRNITVLHLRLGDGLCGKYDLGSQWDATRCKGAKVGVDTARIPNCWENDTDCYVGREGVFYAYPKHHYVQVAADLLESLGNSTRIVVVGDPSHWTRNEDMRNGDYSVDFAYRDSVVSFFRSKGFEVQTRCSSGRPDDDFVYMSSAKNFIQGGGGYSKLVSDVVTANGGQVFIPRTQ